MRNHLIFLSAAALLALALVESGEAQPGKKGKGGKGFGGNPITTAQIVERILAFDKNNDGKVTLDELPERMQHLMKLGDTNKDGALDMEEIRQLAATIDSFSGLIGIDAPGGGPKGKGGKGGKGDGFGPKGDFFGKGGPKGFGEVNRILDDLNLTGATRDRADRVLREQKDKVKKYEESLRGEMVVKMKDVLSTEDYKVFKSAMERLPGTPQGGTTVGADPVELNRRLDQLQRELDDLKKKLAK